MFGRQEEIKSREEPENITSSHIFIIIING